MVTTRRQSELRQLEQPWSSRAQQQAVSADGRQAQQVQHGSQELQPASPPEAEAAAPTGKLAVQALPLTPEEVGTAGHHTVEQQLGEEQQHEQHEQQAAVAQLKSALKAPRPPAKGSGAGEDRRGPAAEVTPVGQGIKKKVRIHSSNNIVHVFGKSSNSGDPSSAAGPASAGNSSSEATPQSRWKLPASGGRPGPVVLGTPTLLKYQASIRSFMGPAEGSGNVSEGTAHQAQHAGEGGEATHEERQDAPVAANGHMSDQEQRQQQQHPQGQGREGAKGGPGEAAGRSRPAVLLPWVAVVAILGWMFASSALIFLNKVIMVDRGFRFPFALTALGSATSTLLGCAAGYLRVAPLRPHPSLSPTLTKLLPIALCSAATLFLGNYAYLGLSVAFINILKALTPAVTLGASMLLGQERPSLLVIACLGLIAGGTAISTAQESSTDHFSWLSFACFILSILFEALRVVLVERLLGRQRLNAIEVLVYLGPLTLLFLMWGAVATEWGGLHKQGLAILAHHPALFVGASLASFAVNTFSFLAIQASSSLTFKVAGCLKNAVVVWLGVATGDSITAKEAGGYALSLLGFLGYTLSRSVAMATAGAASQRAKRE